MSTKSLAILYRQIHRLRDRRRPMQWKDICTRLGIVKANGQPDTGLAYDIYDDPNYVPGLEVLARLGIPAKCPVCKRRMPVSKPREISTDVDPLPDYEVWWRGLKKEERDRYKEDLFEHAVYPQMFDDE